LLALIKQEKWGSVKWMSYLETQNEGVDILLLKADIYLFVRELNQMESSLLLRNWASVELLLE
jgi:hypothetical protein